MGAPLRIDVVTGLLGAALVSFSVTSASAQDKAASALDAPFGLKAATEGLEGVGPLMVRLETNYGVIEAELFEKRVPRTVANFVGLARGVRPFRDLKTGETVKRPYYDGLTFHRVIPNFMVQGGCPEGTGRGGPGFKIRDEFYPTLKHDAPGILSMANSGPNTNGSQFFITDAPTAHLDGRHSVFGRVLKGLDVVRRMARAPVGASNRPKSPVIMKKVTIYRGPAPDGAVKSP